jgi:putative phosphoribosyl transferase
MPNIDVSILSAGVTLSGNLSVPPQARGLVIFAHGSGSSRFSPRNQFVARMLAEAGLGTLLFDLLTAEEEHAEKASRHLHFDIQFLAGRLVDATRWVLAQLAAQGIKAGYFGSSTGAGAALVAASGLGNLIGAVVSRGGRPDLAGDALAQVAAPTLFIVGSKDAEVLELNEAARSRMKCQNVLRIVPGASHLFEEPGTLETAAGMAAEWFVEYLKS